MCWRNVRLVELRRSRSRLVYLTVYVFFGQESMTATVQVGTILIEDRPVMAQALGLQSEPYSARWGVVNPLDGLALDRKIHAAGWNFFFMAEEVKVMFFGAIGAKNIQNAVKRMLGKLKPMNFNCLEVTGIVAKRFLGVPYTVVSAHSRHIQPSCYLDGDDERRTSQRDAEDARG
jgi:hypothetical protein